MQLETRFQLPLPPEQAWKLLLDVERIAPCVPGAELTEIVDERTWKGKASVKLGAVSLAYAGTVVVEEEDEAGRRAVLKAKGTETRGRGLASAGITMRLEEADGGATRVVMLTDLTISGTVAQVGRGMIGDVSQKIANQFAANLSSMLAAPTGEASSDQASTAAPIGPPATAAKPIRGLPLLYWALLRALGRFFIRVGEALLRRAPID
ncbi:MAG TPA: SRPBCC family protein [Thermoanaerobaculia bacterium]|nr:SRPBCC family protein [Thermoanaerobaculia bacterium]